MKAKISFLSIMLMLGSVSAFAGGWQHDGYYVRDGVYTDDGSRVTLGFRGGMSLARAKMKNDIGSLYSLYYMNQDTGDVISYLQYINNDEPDGYVDAGYGDLATLPVNEGFSKTALAVGASIGFVLPHHTNWRLEANYDYISETDYNVTPLLQGSLSVSGGSVGNKTIQVSSTGARATIATDIISAMVYYDFFDGNSKKLNDFIPYVGLGFGYAISKTTLHLSDIYGDLSADEELQNFGSTNSSGVLQFDNPTDKNAYPSSTNMALTGALGLSYGISKYTFLDLSARLTYIPKITWNIASSDGKYTREWFSAENMLYTNFLLGVRFEF